MTFNEAPCCSVTCLHKPCQIPRIERNLRRNPSCVHYKLSLREPNEERCHKHTEKLRKQMLTGARRVHHGHGPGHDLGDAQSASLVWLQHTPLPACLPAFLSACLSVCQLDWVLGTPDVRSKRDHGEMITRNANALLGVSWRISPPPPHRHDSTPWLRESASLLASGRDQPRPSPDWEGGREGRGVDCLPAVNAKGSAYEDTAILELRGPEPGRGEVRLR